MSAILENPVENNNAVAFILENADTIRALSETSTREIVTSKGNVVGRKFIFNLFESLLFENKLITELHYEL